MNKTKYYVKSQGLWNTSLMVIEQGAKRRVVMRDKNEPFWDCINYQPKLWLRLNYTTAKTYLKNYDGRNLDSVLRKFRKA